MHTKYSFGSYATEDTYPQDVVLTKEEFTQELLHFFNTGLKDFRKCTNPDPSELIRRSWNRFQSHLEQEESFEDVYNEVLFSVFEIYPLTSYKLIRKVLQNFLLRKIERYCDLRNELIRDLPLSIAPFSYVDYYADPTDADNISTESFCSPSILLNFHAVKTLLRFGFCFRVNPLQIQHLLRSISSCLTAKLLPLVFKDVQWNASRIISAYQTHEEQRRLYTVLMLLYAVLRSMKPAFYPKWQNYMRSLKLVFKASTEPFITEQEIGRFLSVAAVSEVDKRVKEDFYKILCDEFSKIKEPSTPRSLKQLSCCRIRECLSISGTLPHGVWNLKIPMQLKNYLLLQEKPDEFYPEYVSVLSLYGRKRLSAADDSSAKRLRANFSSVLQASNFHATFQ